MTVRSGESVTSCVRIALGHTTAAARMDMSWSKVMPVKLTCQVQNTSRPFYLTVWSISNIFLIDVLLLFLSWITKAHFHKWWGCDGG